MYFVIDTGVNCSITKEEPSREAIYKTEDAENLKRFIKEKGLWNNGK